MSVGHGKPARNPKLQNQLKVIIVPTMNIIMMIMIIMITINSSILTPHLEGSRGAVSISHRKSWVMGHGLVCEGSGVHQAQSSANSLRS